MWTYNRFGKCNPQAEVCDQSYQPAEEFHVYTARGEKLTVRLVDIPFGGYSFAEAYSRAENEVFFVRSYNSGVGESDDSEHVAYP